MLNFRFAEWLERQEVLLFEAIIQKNESGRPVQLDLVFPNGETNPPVCRNTGIQFDGRGLICFDFDQTLTTAWFGHPNLPDDQASHSTPKPNKKMLKIMEQHKAAGNKVIVVTARGEKEGQMTGSAKHAIGLQPIVTPDQTLQNHAASKIRDFHPAIKNDPRWSPLVNSLEGPHHAYHLGAVSLNTQGEEKGPFIAAKMAVFHSESKKQGGNDYTWGILYDDHPHNVANANAQQKRGIALAGVKVEQTYEAGGQKPVGARTLVGASGM